MKDRSSIPADLKRRVLVEAGHCCAIPVCRELSSVHIHHIIPWSDCKKHEYKNLIALCPNCHSKADKGEIDRRSLYMYKDNLRYVIDKYSKFELDVLYELARNNKEAYLPFPSFLTLLVKRIREERLIEIKTLGGGVFMNGVKANPDALVITQKGRDFIRNIEKEDIGYASSLLKAD